MSIDFELHDGIALITINRPERANAMDAESIAAVEEVTSSYSPSSP